MLTFRVIITAVAVIAVLAAGFLAYSNWKYSGALAEARAQVHDKIAEAQAANAASALAEVAAKDAQDKATAAQTVAAQHAAKARELQAQLAAIHAAIPSNGTPVDTLTATIAAAREARDVAVQAGDSWRQAYESQLSATASLQVAVDTLTPALAREKAASAALQAASGHLANATGPSFWKRLVPRISIGVSAGVNPQGRPDAVAGVSLGWPL